eukprot:6045940-Amphidinium_carterae.2
MRGVGPAIGKQSTLDTVCKRISMMTYRNSKHGSILVGPKPQSAAIELLAQYMDMVTNTVFVHQILKAGEV